MFGIHYIKARPTEFVLHYIGGRLRRSGAGLAFWYYQPSSTIAVIPVASTDVPFAFTEVTQDFQTVTVQGQLTYRVTDPPLVASLLDFTLTSDKWHGSRLGSYMSGAPQMLQQRLIILAQEHMRAQLRERSLRNAVQAGGDIAAQVEGALREEDKLAALGIRVLTLSILAVKPTPEMARAGSRCSRATLAASRQRDLPTPQLSR